MQQHKQELPIGLQRPYKILPELQNKTSQRFFHDNNNQQQKIIKPKSQLSFISTNVNTNSQPPTQLPSSTNQQSASKIPHIFLDNEVGIEELKPKWNDNFLAPPSNLMKKQAIYLYIKKYLGIDQMELRTVSKNNRYSMYGKNHYESRENNVYYHQSNSYGDHHISESLEQREMLYSRYKKSEGQIVSLKKIHPNQPQSQKQTSHRMRNNRSKNLLNEQSRVSKMSTHSQANNMLIRDKKINNLHKNGHVMPNFPRIKSSDLQSGYLSKALEKKRLTKMSIRKNSSIILQKFQTLQQGIQVNQQSLIDQQHMAPSGSVSSKQKNIDQSLFQMKLKIKREVLQQLQNQQRKKQIQKQLQEQLQRSGQIQQKSQYQCKVNIEEQLIQLLRSQQQHSQSLLKTQQRYENSLVDNIEMYELKEIVNPQKSEINQQQTKQKQGIKQIPCQTDNIEYQTRSIQISIPVEQLVLQNNQTQCELGQIQMKEKQNEMKLLEIKILQEKQRMMEQKKQLKQYYEKQIQNKEQQMKNRYKKVQLKTAIGQVMQMQHQTQRIQKTMGQIDNKEQECSQLRQSTQHKSQQVQKLYSSIFDKKVLKQETAQSQIFVLKARLSQAHKQYTKLVDSRQNLEKLRKESLESSQLMIRNKVKQIEGMRGQLGDQVKLLQKQIIRLNKVKAQAERKQSFSNQSQQINDSVLDSEQQQPLQQMSKIGQIKSPKSKPKKQSTRIRQLKVGRKPMRVIVQEDFQEDYTSEQCSINTINEQNEDEQVNNNPQNGDQKLKNTLNTIEQQQV